MEKEFVPYELALRMKHLGFNEPCFGFYNNAEVIPYIKHELNDELREIYKGDFEAPIYSQAFRWFRENYKSNFIIGFGNDGGYYRIDNLFSKWYKTYEEAQLECLNKLIQIVKDGKITNSNII